MSLGAGTGWRHLTKLSKALGPDATPLAPIKQVVDLFLECIDIFEMAADGQTKYGALQGQLENLFEVLASHLGTGPSTMTESMESLCKLILKELDSVKANRNRSDWKHYLAARQEADEILDHYNRIAGYLERLSLNANLSIWKIVDQHATEYRSDHTFSLVDRLSTSLSACYNSAEAAGLKRRACTQDTRVDVLARILDWAGDINEGTVYWLNGMAGTGKTTIAYSVCDKLNAEHKLGASFFCSRLRGECRNVNLILPSIAYQLSRFSRPFMSALSDILKQDPDVHTRLLQLQFEALIKKPLEKAKDTLPDGLVVMIDALDECDDKNSTGQMLDLLLREVTGLPIKFIISSRPEPEIRSQMSERVRSRLVLHELDKGEVQEDIRKYLREGLAPMNPSEGQVEALTQKAGILFIYAATAVRYIGFRNFQHNPTARLQNILMGSRVKTTLENKEIDDLYSTILEAAFGEQGLEEDDLTDMKQVLHAVICAREPLTVSGLSELLRIRDIGRVRAALHPMWSVLHVVETSELVTTLHASFPDFILDITRSRTRYCDSQACNCQLAKHCLNCILETQPDFNICGLDSSYLSDEGVPDIEKQVNDAIPSELLYACQYWADHVKEGDCASNFAKDLLDLLSTKLLLWMEVLNLRKQMKAGTECMKQMVECCKALKGEHELVGLAQDAKRFVEAFAWNPVSQSTPHIYVSMLAFWPRSSPITRYYAKYINGLVGQEGTALERRLLAHLSTWPLEKFTGAMAISPDGSSLALASGEKVVVVEPSSGRKLLEPLEGHTKPVKLIQFSSDGTRVYAGSVDGSNASVLVWDTRSGDQTFGPLHLDKHTDQIKCLCFSPDCTCIATGSNDGTVRLWDTETGNTLHCLPARGTTDSTLFSPDGTRLATGSNNSLQVWHTQTGNSSLGPLIHSKSVEFHTIAFSPDGLRLISAGWGDDQALYVWDAESGEKILGPVQGHASSINCIACSPDGICIVSGSDDQTVCVWNAQTGNTVLGPLEAHTGRIASVTFTPDGSRIISACNDGLVCTWDAQQRNLTPSSTHAPFHPITCIKFSSDGTRFVSGSSEGTISIWDTHTGEMRVGPIKAHTSNINAVDFLNDRVVSGAVDGTICVCDAVTEDVVLGLLELGAGTIRAIGYSPDGQIIATGSKSRVDVWNAQNGSRVLGPLPGLDGWVVSVQFSPDGTHIVASSEASRSNMAVWDVSTGQGVFESLDGHGSDVNSVVYSPNGALIASGSDDETIILWDAYTGEKRLGPLTAHSNLVLSVHFSPDSTRLVSSSLDGTIRIWDVETGEMVFELLNEHKNWITSVEYSPDGRHILSWSPEMNVRIHDARSPAERAFSRLESEVGDWTINKDGWVVDDQSRLLIWVPGDLRTALMWSATKVVVAPQGYVRLAFDKSRLGQSWVKAYTSGTM